MTLNQFQGWSLQGSLPCNLTIFSHTCEASGPGVTEKKMKKNRRSICVVWVCRSNLGPLKYRLASIDVDRQTQNKNSIIFIIMSIVLDLVIF